MKTKRKESSIRVIPYHALDCTYNVASSQEIPPKNKNSEYPANHPASLEARMSTSIVSLDSKIATLIPGLQHGPRAPPLPLAAAAAAIEPQRKPPMKIAFKLGPQSLPLAIPRVARGWLRESSGFSYDSYAPSCPEIKCISKRQKIKPINW